MTREAVGKLEHRFGRQTPLMGSAAPSSWWFCFLLLSGLSMGKPKTPTAARAAAGDDSEGHPPRMFRFISMKSARPPPTKPSRSRPRSAGRLSREFKDGADVKKGDLLFQIDPKPYEAALAAAQADLALNQATLETAGGAARERTSPPSQEWDTAQANASRSEAAVAAAQVNLDHCYIKSPIDGRAGLRNVDVGNVVGPGGTTPLLTIRGWIRSTPISPSPNRTCRWLGDISTVRT